MSKIIKAHSLTGRITDGLMRECFKAVQRNRGAAGIDKVVYVSIDRKWFFAGDSIVNPSPRPATNAADLGWIEERYAKAFNRSVRAVFAAWGLPAEATELPNREEPEDDGWRPSAPPQNPEDEWRYR